MYYQDLADSGAPNRMIERLYVSDEIVRIADLLEMRGRAEQARYEQLIADSLNLEEMG